MNIGLGIGEGVDDSAPAVLDSVTGVADAIAAEFNAGEYKAANIVPTTEVNGALTSFSDKIANSFTALMDRLQTIADGVNFTTPAVMNGIVPYKAASTAAGGSTENVTTAIEASNDELATIITQVVGNASAAIVQAIQTYSGTSVTLDKATLAESVIKEINRRARMAGKSPLVV